jgi:hypothetical protein
MSNYTRGWIVRVEGRQVEPKILHVVPQNDLRPHELSVNCWCRPRLVCQSPRAQVYSHNALDGREIVERAVKQIEECLN